MKKKDVAKKMAGARSIARYISDTSAKKSLARESKNETKRIKDRDSHYDKLFKKAGL